MLTHTRRALTALIITGSLFTSISASAAVLDQKAGNAALSKGRILSVRETVGYIGMEFWIEYKGQIIRCVVSVLRDKVDVDCWDQS